MTQSLFIKGWSLQLGQRLRNFLDMRLGIHAFEDLSNLALWINDKRHSPRQPIKGQRTVSPRNLFGRIGKQWKV